MCGYNLTTISCLDLSSQDFSLIWYFVPDYCVAFLKTILHHQITKLRYVYNKTIAYS